MDIKALGLRENRLRAGFRFLESSSFEKVSHCFLQSKKFAFSYHVNFSDQSFGAKDS